MDLDELESRAATLEARRVSLEEAFEQLRREADGDDEPDDENGSANVPRKPLPFAPAGSAALELEEERELVSC